MIYIIFDLEATCWPGEKAREQQEIIEIGAVALDGDTLDTIRQFNRFVRPVLEPALSEFCQKLTSIRQTDVDTAGPFPEVFAAFLDWIGPHSYTLCSWGDYDLQQLRQDCKLHQVPFPKRFRKKHLNLKQAFADLKRVRPCGMQQALQMLGIPLAGTHHRGIDDARNIARIARVVLPTL
jgi:inhibitor of KinA sporulation pathway (predicted exonuclease)